MRRAPSEIRAQPGCRAQAAQRAGSREVTQANRPVVRQKRESPEEAAAHVYTPAEEFALQHRAAGLIVGSPDTVRAQLDELLEQTEADELMLTTSVYNHADRVTSYELIAALAELSQRTP